MPTHIGNCANCGAMVKVAEGVRCNCGCPSEIRHLGNFKVEMTPAGGSKTEPLTDKQVFALQEKFLKALAVFGD